MQSLKLHTAICIEAQTANIFVCLFMLYNMKFAVWNVTFTVWSALFKNIKTEPVCTCKKQFLTRLLTELLGFAF